MLTLEQVREKLWHRNLSRVSEETGISVSYLSLIRSGERANPAYSVVLKISEYLERT